MTALPEALALALADLPDERLLLPRTVLGLGFRETTVELWLRSGWLCWLLENSIEDDTPDPLIPITPLPIV